MIIYLERARKFMSERAAKLEDFLNNNKAFKTDICAACDNLKDNIAFQQSLSGYGEKSNVCLDCGYKQVDMMKKYGVKNDE